MKYLLVVVFMLSLSFQSQALFVEYDYGSYNGTDTIIEWPVGLGYIESWEGKPIKLQPIGLISNFWLKPMLAIHMTPTKPYVSLDGLNFSPNVVPIPVAFWLFFSGVFGIFLIGRGAQPLKLYRSRT